MTIEIISPIPGKGFNKVHAFNTKGVEDEEDYVELGLIVRDDSGVPRRDATVVVTTADLSQNKTIVGTGTFRRIKKPDGTRELTPFYPFHYEFKNKGTHTVTFTCEGLTKSTTLSVKDKEIKPKKNQ